MNGRAWSAADDNFLREHYPYENTELVASKLNRSANSVRHRALKLGIRKTKGAYDEARADTYKQESREINRLSLSDVPIEKAYMNEEWLRQKYCEEQLSSLDIAELTNVSKRTVLRWLDNYGIERRESTEITGRTRRKISNLASNRSGDKTSRWNGGIANRQGYRHVLIPDHPNAVGGYVAEHRLVMEFILGRLLSEEEVVHHRDGNPKNNLSSNLFLFPSGGLHAKFHQYKRYTDPNISEEEFMRLSL